MVNSGEKQPRPVQGERENQKECGMPGVAWRHPNRATHRMPLPAAVVPHIYIYFNKIIKNGYFKIVLQKC
jgi:hypothetical protein